MFAKILEFCYFRTFQFQNPNSEKSDRNIVGMFGKRMHDEWTFKNLHKLIQYVN